MKMYTRDAKLKELKSNLKKANDKINETLKTLSEKEKEIQSAKHTLKVANQRVNRLQDIVMQRNNDLNILSQKYKLVVEEKKHKIRLLKNTLKKVRERNKVVNKRFDVITTLFSENCVYRRCHKRKRLNLNNEATS